jgi:aarF domain-containing kinase
MRLSCRIQTRLWCLPPTLFPTTPARHSVRFFATHVPSPRRAIRPRHLWLIPLAGGLTLYFVPNSNVCSTSIFSSPTLIPCHPPHRINPTIFSPSESDRSISAKIIALLRDNIWEPLLTAKRFIFLFVLFVPVIVSSPMLLVGKPEKRYRGDKWGAVWWYGLLVRKMEAAGPTFIKVCMRILSAGSCPFLTFLFYS